jgi:hypothetical protein
MKSGPQPLREEGDCQLLCVAFGLKGMQDVMPACLNRIRKDAPFGHSVTFLGTVTRAFVLFQDAADVSVKTDE